MINLLLLTSSQEAPPKSPSWKPRLSNWKEELDFWNQELCFFYRLLNFGALNGTSEIKSRFDQLMEEITGLREETLPDLEASLKSLMAKSPDHFDPQVAATPKLVYTLYEKFEKTDKQLKRLKYQVFLNLQYLQKLTIW